MIKFGIIANTHGLKGHVKILSNSDFKEIRLAKNAKMLLKSPYNLEELYVTVSTSQPLKNFDIVKFKEINHINQAEPLKNYEIYVEEMQLDDDDQENYLHAHLVDCEVYNQNNELLGKVKAIKNFGSSDLLAVETSNQEVLVPFVDAFIIEVNIDNKKIIINQIDGLF